MHPVDSAIDSPANGSYKIKKDAHWQKWMKIALQQAKKAFSLNEVPVGALLLDEQHNLIAKAHNSVVSQNDPTAHAEILVLRQGAKALKNYRQSGCVLVCTLEPCIMCIGACIQARIAGLVFAARDPKSGSVFSKLQLHKEFAWLNHSFWVVEGILKEDSSQILKKFFSIRRK